MFSIQCQWIYVHARYRCLCFLFDWLSEGWIDWMKGLLVDWLIDRWFAHWFKHVFNAVVLCMCFNMYSLDVDRLWYMIREYIYMIISAWFSILIWAYTCRCWFACLFCRRMHVYMCIIYLLCVHELLEPAAPFWLAAPPMCTSIPNLDRR